MARRAPAVSKARCHFLEQGRRKTEVEVPIAFAKLDAQTQRDDRIIGCRDLQHLGPGFASLDGEVDLADLMPLFCHLFENQSDDVVNDPLLDVGERMVDVQSLPAPTQHTVDHRVGGGRAHLESSRTVHRVQSDGVERGLLRPSGHELAIRRLLDRCQGHLRGNPQIGRQ